MADLSQTQLRGFANDLRAVRNKRVEAFDRIERLEELVQGLMEKAQKLEEGLARLEKNLAALPRKPGL